MQQFIQTIAAAFLPPIPVEVSRSTGMAGTLFYLAEHAAPDAKFIVWAHNFHIHVANEQPARPNLDALLRARYGAAYFGLGFEFNQGAFLTRLETPEKLLAELYVASLPPAPERSLPWFLAQVSPGVFIQNLQSPAAHPAVARWLTTLRSTRSISWVYSPAFVEKYLVPHSPNMFDGLIFIERTTASRPTPNAYLLAAARDGL